MIKVEKFKKIYKKLITKNKRLLLPVSLIFIILALITAFNLFYYNKVYPNVKVSGIEVSGLNKAQVEARVSENAPSPEKINLLAGNQLFELSLDDIGFSYNFEKTADSALTIYRSGNVLRDQFSRLTSFFRTKEIGIVSFLNESELNEYLQVVSSQVVKEPVYPSVKIESQNIIVDKGSAGIQVDIKALKMQLENRLSLRDYSPISIPFKNVDPTLTDEESELLSEKADKFLGKSIEFNYEFEAIVLADDQILSFLDARQDYNLSKISDYIKNDIEPKVNGDPQNAVFIFENGVVKEFAPAKEGLTINNQKLTKEIVEMLDLLKDSKDLHASIDIPVERAQPAITTQEVNDLGINELLGRGESTFIGSIAPRVHNISLASSKFNGVLVPPQAVFSFNNTLGDVSSYTGYQQAYVIKDGRTVLGDGGGVCQVSTTFFRAILDAGLPIVERRAHSYRVSYYEQGSPPGLDATVYAPTTDLKFKNDTPGHLLIQTEFKPATSKLIFEIYGTSDGRVPKVTTPITTSSSPPPEDLYIDDPNLPEGTVKQIDYKAWGARVVFNYSVEKEGETIYENTFVSNYRPWQAVFLRGTGPSI